MKHKAFFIFMTALLIGSPLYAQKYKIALIHSYQEGYSGAGIVNKLFVKGLKDQQIDFQLRTFYLDCEKYESVEEERRISEFADSIRSWGGDLIAVLDDQATYSVMACGNPYVRQVPVVFSGVNYPNQELLAQYPNITGYIDKPDYLTTCRMIERIMGKVRIHILNGRTVLDRLIRKDLSEQCKGSEIALHQWKRQEALPDKLNIPISDKDDTEYESLHEKLNEYNHLDSTVIVRLSSDSVAARGPDVAVQRGLQILPVPVYQTGLYHPAHRQPVRQSRIRNHQRRIRDKGIHAGRLFRPHRNTAKRHDRRHQRKTARKDTRPGGKTNRQTAPGQLAGHEEIPDPP